MARWRWRLFAIMARLEASEDVYLRIPNARVARCDAAVPEKGDGSARRSLSWFRKKTQPV